jgi:formamidopyrimidine-DNA glycosylase
MPELPEVETVARGVHERVAGSVIAAVWMGSRPQTFESPRPQIERTLTGSRVESVRRVGKTIVATLVREDSRRVEWLVHLGMTGRLVVCAGDAEREKHTHLVATLEDGREVRFVDPRRFGRIRVSEEPYMGPGTEPLTVGRAEFAELFRGRRLAIKAALLNQSLLHGVGNIYADESLFHAGIRPTRQAGRLTREELERLRLALRRVLREAIKLGGSSVSDYVDAEGVRGFFQLRHMVYQRAGEPCRACKTPIRRIVLAGRSTHYCPHCQAALTRL